MKMKEISGLAASEWHITSNQQKGMKKLVDQLWKREIPEYIPDRVCTFSTVGNYRYIECAWTAPLSLPGAGVVNEMDFALTTELSSSGNVEQY